MPATVIVTTNAPDRVTGYLKTIYLEVYPSVFFSQLMTRKVADKTLEILRDWHLETGGWSLIMLVASPSSPGHVHIETIGERRRHLENINGMLCVIHGGVDKGINDLV